MDANQNSANINEKKKNILPKEKPVICETAFCGLATKSVSIAIEMPIAENSIRYRAVSTETNVTEERDI
jgi:hypothetical protein